MDWILKSGKFGYKLFLMTTSAIKQKLHNYLETADDKKVRAIYTLCEEEIAVEESKYTDDFKAELDSRTADYKSGKAKLVTSKESKRRIEQLLKSRG